ncbi:ribokinase [Streptomyces sp. NPDC060194]|uniref:ribokinase n=1 Tax=Streptomyces sp. NPDC060194 TaxID=3347069 RepID=UPI00365E702B
MTTIAVLGSANMDLVAYVDRAPEKGETITGREFRTVPGGKGANQAIAAARAGGDTAMIGAVGSDEHGRLMRTTFEQSGVDTTLLRTVQGPSGTAHIVVDEEGASAIVVFPGANGLVGGLAAGDENFIAAHDTLLLQLEIPLSGVVAGAEAARRHGVRTILTPSPAQELPPELYAAVDILVPNHHEATALTGRSDPYAAARVLLERVPEVIITLGRQGSLYANREAEPFLVPAPQVRAVDSTGAGDTFVGSLAVALGEGRPMSEALTWAAGAASLSVQKEGASSSMPFRQEIDAVAAGVAG